MCVWQSDDNFTEKMQPIEGTIHWEVDDIFNFVESDGTERDSPAMEIGGLIWKLRVRIDCNHRTGDIPSLGVYLTCTYPEARRFWRVETQYSITLINIEDITWSRGGETNFNEVCYPDTIQMKGHCAIGTLHDILNMAEGFVRNDSITIVARVSVTKTQGVGVENNTRDFSEKNDMSDVCLIIENKQVHVTKAILAEHSSVFKTMFYAKFHEHGKSEIELKDVNHKEFVELLNVIYTSMHGITDLSVESILVLADQFHMKIILEAAGMFLMLHSRLGLGQRLLLTDIYKLDNAQAYLIYTIKNRSEMRNLQSPEWYRKFSDTLKARICDRAIELKH
ncbi:hypothetical protein PRIPAC_87278 [Pristionchus pacificus]|uniref:BTB domain-containing protein n=1 Tax=Pristionchus pacificus TaxID=54126 RepID=A0A2A6CX76_PRIPA|nr:hypothetical protein PRIPAC_87278 [Pristionchus pacificus]|eukprot:PDM82686.1 BTB domain-containing protein [Pristionchus pacificus]